MQYENVVIENFDSILFMEWIEKANSMIPDHGVYKVVSPFLEKDAMKTLAMLQATYIAILRELPVEKQRGFERWCADITQVKIDGKVYNLTEIGFFEKLHPCRTQ